MSSDSILYLEHTLGIEPSHLEGFFEGWQNPPSPETLLDILNMSTHCVLAFDTSAGKVVGFVTCISDGILSAYIPLLEVLPEYRHHGIGTRLMERMLERTEDYYMTDLSCDASLAPFYETFGMQRSVAMLRRAYSRQAGSKKRN